MPADAPRFLTLADVAEVLNVTTRQTYALVRSGELRGIQIGGKGQWRVETTELEDYIQRQYARSEETLRDLRTEAGRDAPVAEDVSDPSR